MHPMQTLFVILLTAGVLVMLAGHVIILVAAFRESLFWGLACLLLPVVQLFFLLAHWDKAKRGFLIVLAGLALVLAGTLGAPLWQRFF